MPAVDALMAALTSPEVARACSEHSPVRLVLYRVDAPRERLSWIPDGGEPQPDIARLDHPMWRAARTRLPVAENGWTAVPLAAGGQLHGIAWVEGPHEPLRSLLDLAAIALGRTRQTESSRWDAAMLRTLLPLLEDGVMLITADGDVVHYSEPLTAAVGWTADDVRQRGWTNLVYATDAEREAAQRAITALMLGRPSEGTRRSLRHKDGTSHTAAIWSAVVPNPTGGAPGLLGVMRNETALVDAELEGLRQRHLAQIGKVARMVAHDFNNLLCTVMGHAELILMRSDDAFAQRHAEIQLAATDKGAALVRQLIAFGSPSGPRGDPLALGSFVADVGEAFRSTLPEGVTLRIVAPEGLPAVEADASMLHHAVTNLLTNAVQSVGSSGRIMLAAEVRVMPERVLWRADDAPAPGAPVGCVVVGDDGSGFKEGDLGQVFEPFFTTRPDGHGVGLSAVQAVMEQHHGGIDVRNDGGAWVRLFLPTSDRPEARLEELRKDRSAGSGQVWILDDQAQILEFARIALSAEGFDVQAFETVDSLLAAAEGPHPDALVLDRKVPGGDVPTALHQLRQLGVQAPVLWASGLDPGGLHPFLQKPYTGRDLARAIRGMLQPTSSPSK